MIYFIRIYYNYNIYYIYTSYKHVFGVKIVDNIIELWNAVLQEIAGNVSNAVLATWIKDLVPIDFDGDCVTVQASSEFKKNIMQLAICLCAWFGYSRFCHRS